MIALVCGIACGVPTGPAGPGGQPSVAPLPFRAGLHVLLIQGDDLRCPGKAAAGISYVAATVTLTLEGNVWVARSPTPPGGGAYEFRLMRDATAADAVGPVPLLGTASGTVVSTRGVLSGPGPDTNVILGGTQNVSLEGTIASTGFIAYGQATGEIVFRNGQGRSVACDGGPVAWSLSPIGG